VGGPRSGAPSFLRSRAGTPEYRVLRPLWLAALAGLLACQGARGRPPADGLPEGYSYSYAMRDCAPWDGPAVTVFLSASPIESTSVRNPFLALSTYRTPAEVVGGRFEWPGEKKVAGGYRRRAEGECEASTTGYVRFDQSLPDGTLIGAFVAQFPHDTVQGGFRAGWVERRLFCG